MATAERLHKTSIFRLLRESKLPISAIVDVGVHYSSPDLIEVFPDLKHYLFEPASEFYPNIRSEYTKLDYVLVEAAVSDQAGTTELGVYKPDGSTVAWAMLGEKHLGETRAVETVTLDGYFKDAQLKNALVKIDVDGHENEIIKGGARFLADASCIVVETGMEMLQARLALVESLGFQLWDIAEPYYLHGALVQFDMVFINKAHLAIPALNPSKLMNFDAARWETITAA